MNSNNIFLFYDKAKQRLHFLVMLDFFGMHQHIVKTVVQKLFTRFAAVLIQISSQIKYVF